MPYLSYKTVDFSAAEQVHTLFPYNLNGNGYLFGGQLVEWIDEVAQVVARRHCETMVSTAYIDNLQFKRSTKSNDIIIIKAKATYVGNKSMEVRVDTYFEDLDGMRYPINRAYLTFVSIDENDKPIPIKFGLTIETDVQEAEWEAAKKRIDYRKKRRTEGF